MIVVYCMKCLPDEKVILGCQNRRGEVGEVHSEHPEDCQTRFFGLTQREWESVVVQGDTAATHAAIVQQFGDRFVIPQKR